MTTKEQFIEMAKGITRPGIDQMMAWLETTDFYTAPASTRFHGAEEGGLCAHSITVAKRLLEIADLWAPNQYSRDALLTVALFHDLCKISTYTVSTRNVRMILLASGPKSRFTSLNRKILSAAIVTEVFPVTALWQPECSCPWKNSLR